MKGRGKALFVQYLVKWKGYNESAKKLPSPIPQPSTAMPIARVEYAANPMRPESLYQPLYGESEIRLVALGAGGFDDPLSLFLNDCDLDGPCEPFEALSYVWRDPSKTVELMLNQRPFQVTTNLHAAFRYLRKRDEPRLLFVDACCIDQANLREKEQQLLLMKRVYHDASRVLVWTGTEDEDNAKALLELGGQIAGFVTQHRERALDVEDISNREGARHALVSNESVNANWRKSLDFLNNEWFSRTWTFQEAYVSREADIICGRTIVSLNALVGVFGYFESIGMRKWSASHSAARVFLATYSWARSTPEGQRGHKDIQVSTLMDAMRHHRASDPRDRIYGILAMLSRQDQLLYAPDYSKDVEETYLRVATQIMNTEQHLSPLSSVNNVQKGTDPSWVMDWRYLPTTAVLAERVREYPPRYHASQGVQLPRPLVQVLKGTQLHLTGGEVDTVSWTYSLSDYEQLGAFKDQWRGVFKQYKQVYSDIRQVHFFLHGQSLPTQYMDGSETHFSAFMHTLATDVLPRSTRRDPDDQQTLFLAHHELAGKTWLELLGPWMVTDTERTMLAAWPADPLTSIYSLLLDLGPDSEGGIIVGPPGQATSPHMRKRYQADMTFTSFSLACLRTELVLSNLALEIIQTITQQVRDRVLFIARSGRLGIGPSGTKVGDKIAAFAGGDVLYVLRPSAGNACPHTLVGEAYVHGLMDGEAWSNDSNLVSKRTILL
ncbi:hypothetical protein LTR15_001363 [Elasticomyces elasticus]|nr:hypothetical protein LTR15_001363 [Elasticomyces elasticus]